MSAVRPRSNCMLANIRILVCSRPAAGGDENAAGEGGEEGAGEEPQEAPTMSLEEYMSQKEKAKSGMPQRQLRKPGEGEGSFNSGVKVVKKLQKSSKDQEVGTLL